jgi:hypothetical protein
MSSRNAQCAVAGVKGISDAVRGALNNWVTEDLITLLWDAYRKAKPVGMAFGKPSFAARIQNAEEWKRYRRGNDPNGAGFFRTYYCKEFGAKGVVDLQVLTNADDTKITYVMFFVNSKMVYGGGCNVPSTLFGQYSYQPMLKNAVKAPIDTGMGKLAPSVAAFVPFTDKQIQKLSTQYEFGGTAAIDRMFEERV